MTELEALIMIAKALKSISIAFGLLATAIIIWVVDYIWYR